MVNFRVAWWFKKLGRGSSDSISVIMLNLKDRCVEMYVLKVPKFKVWCPPNPDSLKFNVDGSTKDGQAGIRGVLRDQNEKVLCTFSANVGNRMHLV